jgi:hypothetical protein
MNEDAGRASLRWHPGDPIESTFATVRLRERVTKGAGSPDSFWERGDFSPADSTAPEAAGA